MHTPASKRQRGTAPLILLATAVVVVICVAAAMLMLNLGPFAAGGRVLTMVDPAGNTVMGAFVALERKGEPDHDAWVRTHEGDGLAVIAAEQIHPGAVMYTFAPGCRVQVGTLPDEDTRINLEAGLLVTLRLKEGLRLPEPPFVLQAELTPLDIDHPAPNLWKFALQESVTSPDFHELSEMDKTDTQRHILHPDTGAVDVLMPRAGRWRVELTVWHYKTEREPGHVSVLGSGLGLGETSDTVIELLDMDEAQTAEIGLDLAAYERIVAEMKEKEGG